MLLLYLSIHPDYYQIPVADREALLAEQRSEAKQDSENDDNLPTSEDGPVETLGGDDTDEVIAPRSANLRRKYKIQEVIKRGQIILVQIVKEERGNKGAALTSYLAFAGRYCVFLPNSDRSGGISRKVTNKATRTRLKKAIDSLGIPEGMAIIVRTAGATRTKVELQRDYNYVSCTYCLKDIFFARGHYSCVVLCVCTRKCSTPVQSAMKSAAASSRQ